ncbi:podocalyxin-like protein 2 isoform X2 [Ascaphus truei]|uniref:podocalyxin-like protein 2 isoform X2 n=1 Tax=Ascaphus truei TaxID=8439 RepID=UPI003F5AD6B2
MRMLQLCHLTLGSLCFLLAACEERSSEGLSSTSLLDLSSLSHLEPLDSAERGEEGSQESDVLGGLLQAPQGSGFSSQEIEESSILQSPQYFWDDGNKGNGSSVARGIQKDYPVPMVSHGAAEERQSISPPKENQETSTTRWSTDPTETPQQLPTWPVEGTMRSTEHNERASSPEHREKTVSKTTSAAPTAPVTKSPRKTKTHSVSRKHPTNRDPGAEPQPGPPAGSHGFPARASPAGHWDKEDGDLVAHPLDVTQKEEANPPKNSSTRRNEGSTKAEVPTEVPWGSEQVICIDWINLAGKNYVILNMSDDINCEQFRWQKGQQLLSLLGGALSWKMETPQRGWVISLSKPNENDKHLLMTITEEQRVLPIKDVFTALRDIKRSLAEIGIESYSTTSSCQSRPSQSRSDYGKLFIVLVIIGSICVMIIISGIIYICWQKRLPKMKNMLHFVENGCHDNPTLDVTMDSQSEMQEKPSLNGGASHGADGWDALISKRANDEAEGLEEDTHL